MRKFRISASTAMEVIGFCSLGASLATISIPLSGIVCGILLIIAGGLSA